MSNREKLKDKNLALFFTAGVSSKTGYDIGMIDGEVAIYNELIKYFKHIHFCTYGCDPLLRRGAIGGLDDVLQITACRAWMV